LYGDREVSAAPDLEISQIGAATVAEL